jgi:hypothetical protein
MQHDVKLWKDIPKLVCNILSFQGGRAEEDLPQGEVYMVPAKLK